MGDAVAFAAAIAAFTRDHPGDAEMRSRCRAVTLQRNSMERIGAELDAVYRAALGLKVTHCAANAPPALVCGDLVGASAEAAEVEIASHAIQSRIRVSHDSRLGARFDRFPVSYYLRRRAADAAVELSVDVPKIAAPAAIARDGKDRRIRLMTVRTYHKHHSCFSGPYQFLRHLGDNYDQTNIIVPLGNELLPRDIDPASIKAMGLALGLSRYAHQGNAWVAEYEIARLLQREPFDIVHFIDGELGGWLATRLPDAVFAGQRPLSLNLLHQPAQILQNMISVPALRRFDVIGAVADDQAEWLRRLVPATPVISVKHGVDTDFFCPAPRRTAPSTHVGDKRCETPVGPDRRSMVAASHTPRGSCRSWLLLFP